MNRQLITHARIVLPDSVLDGSVLLEDGRIADLGPRLAIPSDATMHDAGGRWLIPGIIDIHTDYIEKELNPRPDTNFPLELAFHMMDLRAIGCGLTTVLGAARISSERDGPAGSWRGNGLELARAYERLQETALARHFIHVRWDTNFEPESGLFDEVRALTRLGNLVFNENIPGRRQYRNDDLAAKWADRHKISVAEATELIRQRAEEAAKINNRARVREELGKFLPIGSHDDTTVEDVIEAHACGATLAEMPTTIEAARKAKELGQWVCMGAPNFVRGGSHCGNLSCHEAMAENLVDILCSDYHFPSLLTSVARLIDGGTSPSNAVRMVTINPARALGMDGDLGSIEIGKKADLVLVDLHRGYGRVRSVWVDGNPCLQAHANLPVPELVTA